MRRNMKWTKRISSAMLSAVMVAGLFAGAVPTKKAEAESNVGKAIFNRMMGINQTPPNGFDDDKDPYGKGDEDFLLIEQNELFSFKTYGTDRSIQSIDRIGYDHGDVKGDIDGSITPLKQYKGTPASYNSYIANTPAAGYSFVQVTSFDPNNTKRKDHVAILGVKEDGTIGVTVMNKQGGYSSVELGKAEWLEDDIAGNDDMWDFNSMNFLCITSGDYNNDGHDTLVAYACLDDENYNLFEIYPDYNDHGKYKVKSGSKALLHDQYVGGPYSSKTWVDNKLHCALDTGDINGDGIDDLVVLSYVGYLSSAYRNEIRDLYRPLLATRIGNENITNVTDDYNRRIGVWKNGESMIAGGLSVGDVDGDGYDETVVAGIQNTISKDDNKRYNIDKEHLVTAIYKFNTKYDFTKHAHKDEWPNAYWSSELAPNEWTQSSLWVEQYGGTPTNQSDQSWPQTCVKTVAFAGKGNAESIFINGQLYSWNPSQGSIQSVLLPDYFSEKDDFAQTLNSTVACIRSSAVGVFDDNTDGREQIVYVIGLAIGGAPAGRMRYMIGMMGSKYNEDSKEYDYYSTTDEVMTNSNNYHPISGNAECEADAQLNFAVCAWDNDNDGVHAKYYGKSYAYTDPEVMAILQAPPTFEELDGATDGAGTSYTLTTSYEFEESEGHSVSHSIGAVFQLDTENVKIDASLSAANDWSETFTNTLTTSDEYTFTAIGEDQVVIYRTPVSVYRYVTELDDNPNNKDKWTGPNGEVNYFDITIPQAPVREMLSLSEYNEFAKYYNEENKRLAKEKNKTLPDNKKITDDKIPQLKVIDDQWLGHEGDPLSYMTTTSSQDGLNVLQKTPNVFGMGSSSTGYAWSKEMSHSHEISHAHGFSFDFTITFGEVVYFGVNTSLEYMHEFSSCETTSEGVGTSCEISNIDESLLEETGIPKEIAENYGFNYQMVSWPSGIIKKERIYDFDNDPDNDQYEDVPLPIYGYMLSNIRAAAPPVKDLTAEITKDKDGKEVINLKWSNPAKPDNPIKGFNIYQYFEGGELKKLATVDSNTTTYTYDKINGRTDYTFVIRSVGTLSGTEGVNSNFGRAFIESSGIYAIEYKSTDDFKDTYVCKHFNGEESEFYVQHKSVVSIQKKKTLGDIDVFTVLYSDGTSSEIQVINKVTKGTTVIADDVKAQVTIKDTKPGETPTAVYNGSVEKNVKNIVVPETVSFAGMTYNVTQVADNAFKDNKKLESITIGNNISSIGDNAFLNCTNLKNVSISNKVKEIGDNTFKNCSKLKDVTIPDGVTEIGKNAFMGCTNLTKVSIPKTVTSIDNSTFMNCANLKSVTIPENVKEISNNTFMNCKKLTNVTLPQSLTSIGDNSFTNCTNLSKISIPRNVTKIGKKSFKNCSKLSKVNIGNNTKEIGSSAFANCKSLKSFTIPKNVSKLGNNILNGDYKIKLITIKTKKLNNKSVSKKAFDGISDEITVKVPKSKNKKYSKILVKSGLSKDATIK
ncbi:MAG: leucine-rich repeat protein [Lachnospiraceae bacterium]|nr:leucine-rich repeat protein [Lachnospiraceae bacterium]